ncbi:TlpA disulfide reductase family protein [Streptomyces hainanensis]|uniref:TlpA family protein disulfide reductase n=1 Tax=Streptomyces hainanensis TaxID=402648 RepID=A0A4R4TSH6_9ACTN|nr:TlpA disulfide reductase family protein [Streptomyces hainanensis]TDC78974.1 TlpA family protein disulfide reductase [Streptomyces hainanensis]
MTYQTLITLLVGALGALNLVLALGIIRRLREHTELLAQRPTGSGESTAIAVGERVGDFAAVTRDGAEISTADLAENAVVAFFSPDCGPCRDRLPSFVEFARTVPGGARQVLAVVVDVAGDGAEFVRSLGEVARVVVEKPDGSVSDAFQVRSYPTILRVTRRGDDVLVADNRLRFEARLAKAGR